MLCCVVLRLFSLVCSCVVPTSGLMRLGPLGLKVFLCMVMVCLNTVTVLDGCPTL